MLSLVMNVTGRDADDLAMTLQQAAELVERGKTEGGGGEDGGVTFSFAITGEEERHAYTCERCGYGTDNEDEVNFTKDAILCHDCYAEREAEMGDDTSWQ
jgi:hypothetical protein